VDKHPDKQKMKYEESPRQRQADNDKISFQLPHKNVIALYIGIGISKSAVRSVPLTGLSLPNLSKLPYKAEGVSASEYSPIRDILAFADITVPMNFSRHIEEKLKHLYISPLEQCNLCCRMCYTAKPASRLSETNITAFIRRYTCVQKLESVTFCGGEVMLLPYFTKIVNGLVNTGTIVQIITNGTVDRLDEFIKSDQINMIVSLDGLPPYHDKNRGAGNSAKSIGYLQKAHKLGFQTGIFSIVTGENSAEIPEFEKFILASLGYLPDITYHPRKPLTYLSKHPTSNRIGETAGFSFPDKVSIRKLAQNRKIFPDFTFGCYQLSLMSDGNVYACCEGIHPVGAMNDDIPVLIANFRKRLVMWQEKFPQSRTNGCAEPDFVCGLMDGR
jgi:molybdenum cofactor biosynthesis enzyme MoaA